VASVERLVQETQQQRSPGVKGFSHKMAMGVVYRHAPAPSEERELMDAMASTTESDLAEWISEIDKALLSAGLPLRPDRQAPPHAEMSEVSPHIYVGSSRDARNVESLKAAGITCVINCGSSDESGTSSRYYDRAGISYVELGMHDSNGAFGQWLTDGKLPALSGTKASSLDRNNFPPTKALDMAMKTIRSQAKYGRSLLLHCVEGKNRSVAIGIAFLVRKCQFDLISAIVHVKRLRPESLSNRSYIEQLVIYHALLGCSSPHESRKSNKGSCAIW